MRYKKATGDIPFISPYQKFRNFSDTDYNTFVDKVNRVEYKTAAQAGASHHCIHFYTEKANLNEMRNLAAALNPNFMQKAVKKTTNEGSGVNKHVQFMMYGSNTSPKVLVSEGKAYAKFFQDIKANGRIARYDNTNPLKAYTQNGTVVTLTAANNNAVWITEQDKITTPSTTVDQSGNNKAAGKSQNPAVSEGLFTTQNIIIAGVALLLLFFIMKKKKKE